MAGPIGLKTADPERRNTAMDEDTEFLQLEGLRSGIKAEAIVAAKMLRDAGWQLHRIHWQSKSAAQ
jgi:hypothetical protein